MADRPIVPRIVKPRKRSNWWRNIIAIDRDEVLLETTGQLYSVRDDLETIIIAQPSSLVVAHNVGFIVKDLDRHFSVLTNWNFKAVPVEREVWKPNRAANIVVTDTVIGWFGFKGRVHFPLDPLVFSRSTVHDLIPGDAPTIAKLLLWGQQYREWMLTQGITFKTTQGGVASALLRDSRFYPNARRKVPAATNAKARPKLPGNYYRLKTSTAALHRTALYFDQIRAHHSCARDLSFPDADSLYGKGRFRNPDKADKLHARSGTAFFDRLIQEPGLFCLDVINKGKYGEREYPLPIQERPGRQRVYVYSNELDYLRSNATIIEGIVAAWTSAESETGLNRYAEWSLAELDKQVEKQAWLKPCLLATYGVLATTPRRLKIGFRQSVKGTDKKYPVGGALLDVKEHATRADREANIVNVIHRGMIEAETRLRSLKLAKLLDDAGLRIIAIYADSVFASTERGQTLPMLPTGWKIEAALTALQFVNEVSFVSNELVKLPGITREERDRVAHRLRNV
jgi:hypothetical protein